MLIIPQVDRRAIVDLITGAGGTLETVVVGLYIAPMTITPQLAYADMIANVATFGGYAASTAVVWSSVFDDGYGNAVELGDLKLFIATGTSLPQTAYGYFLYTVIGTTLHGVEAFDTPIVLSAAFDAVPVLPRISFGQ